MNTPATAPAAERATTSLQGLREAQAGGESRLPAIAPGFSNLQAFELLHREAKLLSSSTLVPVQYRQRIVKLNYDGSEKSNLENINAIPNTMIALNMALRMGADPVMVMQNLYIVEGRPSWSSQWIIAQINQCGRFSPLRFEIEERGKKTAKYTTYEWVDNVKRPKVLEQDIEDVRFRAFALEKGTNEKLYGPWVSLEMAVQEGWYTKNGSKWQTMPEVMGRYRAAAFFGKLYAPELLMGIPSQEEVEDVVAALQQQADGSYAPSTAPAPREKTNVESLRRDRQAGKDASDATPKGDERTEGDNGPQASAGGEQLAAETAASEQQQPAQGEQQNEGASASTAGKAEPSGSEQLFGNTD